MPPINMVHPTTGRVQQVAESDVDVFARLGYRPEGAFEATARSTAAGTEAYWSSPIQKVGTAIEGAASGATLGLSDLILDDDASSRASYNPGTRLVGELVGAIGTGHLPVAPAGVASRAGAAAGKAFGTGITAKAVGVGVEGALQGAGAGLSHAALSGDPITAEAVLSGAGLGAATGAGLGFLSGAVGRMGERAAARASKVASETGGLATTEARISAIKEELGARSVARAEATTSEDTARAAEAVSRTSPYEHILPESEWGGYHSATRDVADDLASASTQVDHIAGTVTDKAYRDIAVGEGKRVFAAYEALSPKLQAAFKDHVVELRRTTAALNREPSNIANILEHEQALGVAARNLKVPISNMPKAYSVAAKSVMDKAESAALVADALDDFPSTVKGFASTTDKELDTLVQAATQAKGMVQDIGPRAAHAEDALQEMVRKAGLTGPEDLVVKLKQLRNTLRKVETPTVRAERAAAKSIRRVEETKLRAELSKLEAERAAQSGAELGPGGKALQWGVGLAGAKAGRMVGIGPFLGYHAATSLLHLKAKVLNGASAAVARLARPVASGLAHAGPLLPRVLFATSLLGDGSSVDSDVVKGAKQRIDELVSVAPHVEDVAMAAMKHLSEGHPELGAAMAGSYITAVKYLAQVMPKDPGTVYMRGVSVWDPSPVQARDFGERWYTVMNPGQALLDFVDGRLSPVAVHALANGWPAVYDAGRQMLMKGLPEALPTMNKSQRSRAGFLLGVPLDGTAAPSFVDFLQKNLATAPGQGNGGVPGPGSSPGAGRPPGPDESALTDAERILLK